ncbi:hypothetical protein TSUD_394220 [Trifolium subterraneum]|uniref:BED-type domain-containing protein n=1 Tax=Trifolium subterraneum TaxID=3900 RepID=A0A2Z6MTE2_TRISU|nr:hypothetical protein TSUD_394220 [Trifolium subterraneum]
MSTSGSVAHSSQSAPPTQSVQSASHDASLLQSTRRKMDPAWDYCTFTQVGEKKTYTCMFCQKVFKGGGIHRFKEHLAGEVGDAKPCLKVDADTRFRMGESLKETSTKKKRAVEIFDDEHPFGPNVVEVTDDDQPTAMPSLSRPPTKRAATSQIMSKSFFAPRTTSGTQPKIKSVLADLGYAVAPRATPSAPGATSQNRQDYSASSRRRAPCCLRRYYRDPKARDFVAVVLDSRFWNDVEIIVKIVAPLVCLLRIVDGDDRPSLGYVYDGMFRAKKAIKNIFMNKKSLYKPYTRIIKQRWDKHLRQQLHAAAYVLNPTFYYDKENLSQKPEVMAEFLDVLTTQVDGNRTKFLNEANLYRGKVGEFGKQLALDSIKHIRPDMWWNTFEHGVPNVQKWAIKILSQTASSSGCERNWSVFERIHTKKRNRLEHQRLNDLVYVHYNLRLKNRAFNKKGAYDPIDYERIDDIEFWITDEDTNSTPILDADEIENMLYNKESIPMFGLDNGECELAPTIGLEEGGLNLDSFPQEDVNSYSGADDDGFNHFND